MAPLFHRLFYLLLAYALPASEISDELETMFYALDRSSEADLVYLESGAQLRTPAKYSSPAFLLFLARSERPPGGSRVSV